MAILKLWLIPLEKKLLSLEQALKLIPILLPISHGKTKILILKPDMKGVDSSTSLQWLRMEKVSDIENKSFNWFIL